MQKYAKLPAGVNVCDPLWFRLRAPVSLRPEGVADVPDVDVCDAVSRFVHVTFVPTVIGKFSSVKLAISVEMFPGAGVAVGTEVGMAVGIAVGTRVGVVMGTGVEVELAPPTELAGP